MIAPLRRVLEACLAPFSAFDAVYLVGKLPPPDRTPVLFAANHVGWWDGFLLWRLQRAAYPGYASYTVMLDRELAKRRWFRHVGAIGITPGDFGSLRRALLTLRTLSRKGPFTLSFFPQGKIFPSTKRPLGFQVGVQRFAQAAGARTVCVGIHVEPMTSRRPVAFLVVGEPGSTVEDALDGLFAVLHRDGEDALATLGTRRI